MKLDNVFKLLKGPIRIEKVRCLSTGVAVEGELSTPALLQLSEEQIYLVELLAIHGGNLKKVARDMDITYPTLKNRLDHIGQVLIQESDRLKKRRSEILDQIEQGKITPEQGADMLESL